jgi:predicted transcriptional regulator
VAKQTQVALVLAVLEEGPSTAPEMAAETGLSLKHCSAYLTTLVNQGVVRKGGRVISREPCGHCGRKRNGAAPFIYELVPTQERR